MCMEMVSAKAVHYNNKNTEALLASMPKKQIRIDDYIGDNAGKGLNDKSWDDLDRAGKLNELKNQDPAAFAQKFEEKFGVPYKD